MWQYRVRVQVALIVLVTAGFFCSTACAVVRFAVIGDYGSIYAEADTVAQMVLDWNPDFIVSVGDNNYGDVTLQHDDWDTLIGARYGSYIRGRSDNRYPNQTSQTARFFPVVGNHDVDDGGSRAGFLDYFFNDPAIPAGRIPTRVRQINDSVVYYDFTVDNVTFYMLDSEHEDAYRASRSQQEFLYDDRLESSRSPWNFTFFHHPAISSGYEDDFNRMEWAGRLRPNIDVVFSGHDHIFEHIHRTEADYFIVGTGGQRLYHIDPVRIDGSLGAFDQYYGAMFVTVEDYKATFEFNEPGHGTRYRYQIQRLPEPGLNSMFAIITAFFTSMIRRHIRTRHHGT
jgi:hypothetical protein